MSKKMIFFIILTVLIFIVFVLALVLSSFFLTSKYGEVDLFYGFAAFSIITLIQSGIFFIIVPVILLWLVLLIWIISSKMEEYSKRVTENQKENLIPYKYD